MGGAGPGAAAAAQRAGQFWAPACNTLPRAKSDPGRTTGDGVRPSSAAERARRWSHCAQPVHTPTSGWSSSRTRSCSANVDPQHQQVGARPARARPPQLLPCTRPLVSQPAWPGSRWGSSPERQPEHLRVYTNVDSATTPPPTPLRGPRKLQAWDTLAYGQARATGGTSGGLSMAL